MTSKISTETVTPQKSVGDSLNYGFDYAYDENYAHRLTKAGERHYRYDANGNVVCEQDGSFEDNGESAAYHKTTREAEDVYSTDYGWGLFKDESGNASSARTYRRTYAWDERNRLVASVDANRSTAYVYGHDGQRSNKYTQSSETLYFNRMWTLHTDSGNGIYGGQTAKNIYLGETRIVTKLNSGSDPTYQEECYKQYFYHSDHLGSAALISDYKGDEYQRIEYTPYGETWVEKTSNTGLEHLPYRFTAKELDEETGLYYYGARYLDPKYSRWISADPALVDYLPSAPINEEAKRHNQNLPGMGGVFNHINGNLYHYAANNPVRYTDPDGRVLWQIIPALLLSFLLQSDSQTTKVNGLPYEPEKWNSNPNIMASTNCYAYALNLQKNPITGKPFPKRGEGGFALQPGDLFGSRLTNLKPSTIETLVSLDCRKINYTFKETSFEESVKKGDWKVALVIRNDDYHWYRQNEDGTWSHKPGSTPVKNTDDAGNIIFDPRAAKSSYRFVKFYEVGPND